MHFLNSLSEPILYVVAFSIVFLETGVVPFFFLPGDSLLFSLGLFAHQDIVDLTILIPVLIVASFVGNILGYYLGSFIRGKRQSSSLLRKVPEKYIEKTELFYKKYGSGAIILSRFVPVVRTIAPFLAGVSRMNYKKFLGLSFVGGVLWSVVVPIVGFAFGSYFKILHVVYTGVVLMVGASIVVPILLYMVKRFSK